MVRSAHPRTGMPGWCQTGSLTAAKASSCYRLDRQSPQHENLTTELRACKHVWSHRTGNPMPIQALSAGTSLTLRGVTAVAAHCSVLEPKRPPRTTAPPRDKRTLDEKVTDLLHTDCGHGWFSGEAGLQVAQYLLHTLKESTFCRHIACNVKSSQI